MKISLHDYCLEHDRKELLQEWAFDKNGELRPETVSYGSKKKIWWRCEKGHEWDAAVFYRTIKGNGCPVCDKKAIIAGENDLATTHPAVAEQWHPTKNGDLTPSQVASGSHRRVWWRCKDGHEWLAQINSRGVDGNDCPYCSHRIVSTGETDLATLYPEILEEWAWDKNAPLKPDQVTALSNKKAWWRCKLGHEWSAVIASRTVEGKGCPYCAGKKVWPGFNDLETKEPIIASQWHPTLNGELTPEMVSCGSKKRVWWQCADGHVWNAVVYSRATGQKCGCPVCAGNTKRSRTQD